MDAKTLWTMRAKSLGWNLVGVVVTALIGYFMSSDFANLLTQYTGTTVTATLFTLFVSEVAKHLRNKHVIAGAARAEQLGGVGYIPDLL